MNAGMFMRVADAIQSHQSRFDLGGWFGDDQLLLDIFDGEAAVPAIEACNTTACVAGWAVLVGAQGETGVDVPERARELLGISYEQSLRLFYGSDFVIAGGPSVWAELGRDRVKPQIVATTLRQIARGEVAL